MLFQPAQDARHGGLRKVQGVGQGHRQLFWPARISRSVANCGEVDFIMVQKLRVRTWSRLTDSPQGEAVSGLGAEAARGRAPRFFLVGLFMLAQNGVRRRLDGGHDRDVSGV